MSESVWETQISAIADYNRLFSFVF